MNVITAVVLYVTWTQHDMEMARQYTQRFARSSSWSIHNHKYESKSFKAIVRLLIAGHYQTKICSSSCNSDIKIADGNGEENAGRKSRPLCLLSLLPRVIFHYIIGMSIPTDAESSWFSWQRNHSPVALSSVMTKQLSDKRAARRDKHATVLQSKIISA
jgi:hypothetical protein